MSELKSEETASVPLQSTEEMEALILKALRNWRRGDAPDELLAKTLMAAIQCEVMRSKGEIVSMLRDVFRPAP